ncbi:MAG TPA: hypothetical protein PK788_11685 [Gemmatimonadaceae bacterium]|nr:hypothetical protein [Gemmatimonadaceae bacterium]
MLPARWDANLVLAVVCGVGALLIFLTLTVGVVAERFRRRRVERQRAVLRREEWLAMMQRSREAAQRREADALRRTDEHRAHGKHEGQ